MKQIEVQIMGQSYLLACTEDGENKIMQAVEKVDAAMCKIRDAAKIKARERIAVLAALNLAFDATDTQPTLVKNHTQDTETGFPSSDDELMRLVAKLDKALADDGRLF